MTLKEHIDDIREGLETDRYSSEADVSQGIVQRLLHVLTWPMYNIQVIIPEYSVEGRRVDYALCDPASKPLVFIEVKQVGNIDGAERQLFEYAFHEGVPIALLTDGQKWRFFHPTGQGNYTERKVCELDLLEGDSEKSATHLNRYLNYEKIRTREAVRAIEEDYGKVSRQREAAARLPEAWGKLVDEADEFLLHAVAEKTESLCGHRPTDEQVLDFLKSLERKTEMNLGESPASPIPPGQPTQRRAQTRLVVTMPNGDQIEKHNAQATFFDVIVKLGPEKVMSAHPSTVSTSPFPNGRHDKHGQFYISTNHGTPEKKRRLERIAKRLDVQLKVEVVEK